MKLSWALPQNATCIQFYLIHWSIKKCQKPKPEVVPEREIGTDMFPLPEEGIGRSILSKIVVINFKMFNFR